MELYAITRDRLLGTEVAHRGITGLILAVPAAIVAVILISVSIAIAKLSRPARLTAE